MWRLGPEMPQFPPGSPFEEFFKEFFDRQQQRQDTPRRKATSLGSGFIIDPTGVLRWIAAGAAPADVKAQVEKYLPPAKAGGATPDKPK